METERLIKLGSETLGLKGKDLKKWVDEQFEAEERRKNSDLERLRAEELLKHETLEREEGRRNAEHERIRAEEILKQETLEREEARKKSDEERKKSDEERKCADEKRKDADLLRLREEDAMKRDMLEREAEILRLRLETSSGAPVTNGSPGVGMIRGPKLPHFDEAKDKMDSYLLRFERFATINGWHKEHWAVHLSALLKGKALDAYSRLHDNEAENYDVVKETLLKRYNMTSDGFKERFRSSRPEAGEGITQFSIRLKGYLDKWVEMSGKDKNDVEQVLDLLLQEQLMDICSSNLRVFLRERKPNTSEELVNTAEMFIEAHGVTGAYSKGRDARHETRLTTASTSKPNTDIKPLTCHICSRTGHRAIDCWKRDPKMTSGQARIPTCSYCKKRGHVADKCWERQRPQTRNQIAAVEISPDRSVHPDCSHGNTSLICGCVLPSSPASETIAMPVLTGLVNGKKVKVLRDSGCTCVVVKRSLIDKIDKSPSYASMQLADGGMIQVPIVNIYLECPFYKGEVRAVAMDTPLYDVILGNIPGAKWPERNVPNEQAVDAKESSEDGLANLVGLSQEQLISLQKEDATLEPFRKLATSQDIVKSGKASQCQYNYEEGVLLRYFSSPTVECGNQIKQIVVPTLLRDKVMRQGHDTQFAGHLAAKKTAERILPNFYWPKLWKDVERFCHSCDHCPRSTPKRKPKRVARFKRRFDRKAPPRRLSSGQERTYPSKMLTKYSEREEPRMTGGILNCAAAAVITEVKEVKGEEPVNCYGHNRRWLPNGQARWVSTTMGSEMLGQVFPRVGVHNNDRPHPVIKQKATTVA